MIYIMGGHPKIGPHIWYHIFKSVGLESKLIFSNRHVVSVDRMKPYKTPLWPPKEDILYIKKFPKDYFQDKQNDFMFILGFAVEDEKYLKIFPKGHIVATEIGTDFRRHNKKITSILNQYDTIRFAPPHNFKYDDRAIQLFWPMQIDWTNKIKPDDRVIITHSPWSGQDKKVRELRKGTSQIREGVKRAKKKLSHLKIEYKEHINVTWRNVLEDLGHSHCHVEMISNQSPEHLRYGGIGYSACEGIASNCVTLTSCFGWKDYRVSKFYPPHPMILIQSANDVTNELVRLLSDGMKEYKREYEKVKAFKKYINFKNTGKWVLHNWKELREYVENKT